MRLLVIRTDRLGDTVLTLPAVTALKKALPEAVVDVCCSPGLAPLVERCSAVEQAVPWKPEFPSFHKDLRERGYDGVAMVNSRPSMAWSCLRAGIPIRCGRGRKWYSLAFTRRDGVSYTGQGIHEAEVGRRIVSMLADSLGANIEEELPTVSMDLPEEAVNRAQQLLAENDISGAPVVLQPGSGGSSLDWPIANMVALADALRAKGVEVVAHIGPAEQELQQAFSHIPVVGSDLDLLGLTAILWRARCLVGNSTGPLHLAAALGVPVVGLYPNVRAMTPERWGALGASSVSMTAPAGRLYDRAAQAPEDHMSGITVDQVLGEVMRIIEK